MKITPQRQPLFRPLHEDTERPTAEALYEQASAEMPGISLRTVYQTLTDLTSMGELRHVTFGHGPAHFDPNVAEHDHAVCDDCGTITDVYAGGADQLAIDGLAGFRPESTSIVLHGTRASCAGT